MLLHHGIFPRSASPSKVGTATTHRVDRRQVFGLAGRWPTRRGFPGGPPSAVLRLSFPLTAAGQSRILTGFPLASLAVPANRR